MPGAASSMTLTAFERSALERTPPEGLTPALVALWWTKKGDWEKSHAVVMGADDKDSAWVHAHLHRVERDLANAGYWYARAGKPRATGPLADEWRAIAAALLDSPGEQGGCFS
jgi:hypothetical protein